MNRYELVGIRESKGISQKSLAEKAGIEIYNYRNKESGKTSFTISEAVKISNSLGMTLEQFNSAFCDGELKASEYMDTVNFVEKYHLTYEQFNDIFYAGKLPFGNAV